MSARPGEFAVVIPSRYGSSRFEGKPLQKIAGVTMIRRVHDNAAAAGAGAVIVATDDTRIAEEVKGFGGRAMMTDGAHRSGTDRIAEVARREGWDDALVVVNLQGDEPLVPPAMIRAVAEALEGAGDAGIATMAHPITAVEDLTDPNAVKVVCDSRGRALYFSRAPIPFPRGASLEAGAPLPAGITYLRHLGIYAYRVGALARIAGADPTPLEETESLEQLRAMELGIGIQVSIAEEAPGIGVDTPEDLRRVEQLILAGETDEPRD